MIAEFDHIAAGPLVRLTFEPVGEEYVLAYFDSLRPVDKDDVEFTQGWSVRPRGSNA